MSLLFRIARRNFSRSPFNLAVSQQLVTELTSIVGGSENLSQNLNIRSKHGKDEGHFESHPADIVIWPENVQQVSDIVRQCNATRTPIVPFGTGTGLEGGVNAIKGGVCIDMSKMNRLIEVNENDFDCQVEAGLTWRDLNVQLRTTGLWMPVDPGASASLGGMAATGASGTNAVRYGTIKENILNLEIVLANGDVINTSGIDCRARKSSAGYNLTPLFVGSEGTLGVITKLRLKLHAISNCVAAAVCTFENVQSAIKSVIETLQSSVPIARIEFLDELSMKAARSYSKIELPEKPALFLEFHANSEQEIEEQLNIVKNIVNNNQLIHWDHKSELEERNKLWKARHDLYYACLALAPNSEALTTDVCVPISSLPQMIFGAKKLLNENGLIGPILGHVGDGNFHSLIVFKQEQFDNVKSVANSISRLSLSLGGTCTGEHGVGRGKVQLLTEQFDPITIRTMKAIKSTLDPLEIMNPGKVLI